MHQSGQPETDPTNPSRDESVKKPPLGLVATIAALILIGVYVAFLVALWGEAEAGELTWARHAILFNGLEALAFAAVGALLGTTVQRQVTKKAEEQAAGARKEASEQQSRANANERAAEKGRALEKLAIVRAAGETTGSGGGGPFRSIRPDAGSPGGSSGVAQELVELARLYDKEP